MPKIEIKTGDQSHSGPVAVEFKHDPEADELCYEWDQCKNKKDPAKCESCERNFDNWPPDLHDNFEQVEEGST